MEQRCTVCARHAAGKLVVCIDALGVADATHRVSLAGLNPGGEIVFTKIPDGERVREDYCNRLLNKEEALNAPTVETPLGVEPKWLS